MYQNTHATKFVNSVRARKVIAIARYADARDKLLRLTKNDMKTEQDFPMLSEEDTYAKNATSSRSIGDRNKVDSWIWTFGHLRGMSPEEKHEYTFESKL